MKSPRFSERFAIAAVLAAGSLSVFFTACIRTSAPAVSTDRAKQQRFNWNFETLVKAYEKAGFANRAWDEPARRALTEFARMRAQVAGTNEPGGLIVATNCEVAVKAGCTDPMIAYLYARFTLDQTNSRKAFTEALCNAAQGMEQSSYPAMRKFYAWLRAGEQVHYTYGYGTNVPQEYLRMGIWDLWPADLQQALEDKTTPAEEVYDACGELLGKYCGDKNEYAQLYYQLEPAIFKHWPDASTTWLLKGEAYIEIAWQARGGGYANTVTKEGWKGFEANLKIAEDALDRAWKLNPKDPRIARKMLTLELGQGKGRDRMELWFNRAMELDPNNYDACEAKRYYLEPKWYGSEEAMLDFGWQCVESTQRKGRVPLILLNVHESIRGYLEESGQTNYWTLPQVWPDIRSAFEKFLQLNPDATGWYHNYAKYAYLCQQWRALNALIPKLGPVNYDYFGGKAAYDQMVGLTREHAADTNAEINAADLEFYRWNTKLAARVQAGKTNETDYADLFKAGDALVARHKADKTEEVAQILFARAMLYLQVFDQPQKARERIAQLKRDFPETKPGRSTDQILAAIDRQAEVRKIQSALAVGRQFPGIEEKDLTARSLSTAACRGKILLIDFWATWCGPCVAELPNVLKTYGQYHDQGFEIIGISLDEDRQKLENFIQQRNVPWQQYFDGKGWSNKLAVKYGVDSIPATFLVDREGRIIAKNLRGAALDEAVRKALASR